MTVNHLTLDRLRELPLPMPEEGSKEQRGTVLVVGGSADVPGAAFLAGVATLRAGAGRLRIATVKSAASAMALAMPEARVIGFTETEEGGIDPASAGARLPALAERCNAILIGPGLSAGDTADALLMRCSRHAPRQRSCSMPASSPASARRPMRFAPAVAAP